MAYKEVSSDFGLDHTQPHTQVEVLVDPPDGAAHIYKACGEVAAAHVLAKIAAEPYAVVKTTSEAEFAAISEIFSELSE